jgi:hypothetical protein
MEKIMRDIGDNTVYRIDWQRVFPVVLLPRALRITFSTGIFLLTFVALLLTIRLAVFVGPISNTEPSNQKPIVRSVPRRNIFPQMTPSGTGEDWIEIQERAGNHLLRNHGVSSPYWNDPSKTKLPYSYDYFYYVRDNSWSLFTMPGYNLYRKDTGNWGIWGCRIVWFAVLLILWTFFGAAITRSTAVRFSCNQREGFLMLGSFVRKKWRAYLGAVLMPMLGIAVCLVPLWLEVLLKNTGLMIVAAVGFPIAVFFALLALFLAIGLVLGWPLMFAAISAEGTDSFDAIGRAYSYIYQRPIQFFFYHGVNFIIYSIGSLLMYWIVSTVINIVQTHGYIPTHTVTGNEVSALLIVTILWLLEMAVMVFPIVYFWVSSTVIYFLLRLSCDATPMDEIYRHGSAAVKRTLPPIVKKADGTSEMASSDA